MGLIITVTCHGWLAGPTGKGAGPKEHDTVSPGFRVVTPPVQMAVVARSTAAAMSTTMGLQETGVGPGLDSVKEPNTNVAGVGPVRVNC